MFANLEGYNCRCELLAHDANRCELLRFWYVVESIGVGTYHLGDLMIGLWIVAWIVGQFLLGRQSQRWQNYRLQIDSGLNTSYSASAIKDGSHEVLTSEPRNSPCNDCCQCILLCSIHSNQLCHEEEMTCHSALTVIGIVDLGPTGTVKNLTV